MLISICRALANFTPLTSHIHLLATKGRRRYYGRFSKLELCGRLGDEVVLDMHLASEDSRLRYIAKPFVQS
jgi:hypothetical protein